MKTFSEPIDRGSVRGAKVSVGMMAREASMILHEVKEELLNQKQLLEICK